MPKGVFITLTMIAAAAIAWLSSHLYKKRVKRKRRERLNQLARPKIEAISLTKKVFLDEGEVQTIPVSILPKEAAEDIEVEYTQPEVCKVELVEEGLILTAIKQGKVVLTVHSGDISERCIICVRKRLNLDITLLTDKSTGDVRTMMANLKSDDDFSFRCQVLFNITVDGKNSYFFANANIAECIFKSNRMEIIPHVAEELAKLREKEDRIQSLRLWVTNLRYDQDRYHIIVKNRYRNTRYWWKKYDK